MRENMIVNVETFFYAKNKNKFKNKNKRVYK